MKISNPLIRGFYSGLIAGIIGGIAFTGFRTLDSMLGLWAILGMPAVTSFDTIISVLGYSIGHQGIYGGIFGIIYFKFYNRIPGKGIEKGIVYGLIIGALTDIAYGTALLLIWVYAGIGQYFNESLGWIISAFYQWLPYGIVLGVLYERLK